MIPLFKVSMDPEITSKLGPVLRSGYIGQGPKVEEFEAALEMWLGRKPVTVNSGTSALMVALRLAGIRPGDQVATTPMTCSATNVAIAQMGAFPLWVDVDPRTGLMDPEDLEVRLSSNPRYLKPKAVMVVDWGGQPADYKKIWRAAKGIPIISDAAHSFGASYEDGSTWVFADYVALSFQAIKHLTTGDGGALIVPELEVRRAKLLRWFGLDRETPQTDFRGEQDITEAGWKFQMNDIAATIGLANLEGIDEVLLKHRENAAFYNANLAAGFTRTTPTYRHEGSWWVYTVLLPTEAQRDEFKRYMVDKGIQVSQVHWRNDKLSIFSHFRSELPGVDEFASRMICLPVHPDTPVQRVLQVANSFFGEANE